MQGAMWLILAAAVAAASVVGGRNELGPARQVGPISVQLPEGWEVEVPDAPGASASKSISISARDPGAARALHLVSERFADPADAARSVAPASAEGAETLKSGGLEWTVERTPVGGNRKRLQGWIAGSATPAGRAVVVLLGSAGPPSESDRKVLEQVVRSVRVRGE